MAELCVCGVTIKWGKRQLLTSGDLITLSTRSFKYIVQTQAPFRTSLGIVPPKETTKLHMPSRSRSVPSTIVEQKPPQHKEKVAEKQEVIDLTGNTDRRRNEPIPISTRSKPAQPTTYVPKEPPSTLKQSAVESSLPSTELKDVEPTFHLDITCHSPSLDALPSDADEPIPSDLEMYSSMRSSMILHKRTSESMGPILKADPEEKKPKLEDIKPINMPDIKLEVKKEQIFTGWTCLFAMVYDKDVPSRWRAHGGRICKSLEQLMKVISKGIIDKDRVVVLCDEFQFTPKCFYALLQGNPIVGIAWFNDSIRDGHCMDVDQYLIPILKQPRRLRPFKDKVFSKFEFQFPETKDKGEWAALLRSKNARVTDVQSLKSDEQLAIRYVEEGSKWRVVPFKMLYQSIFEEKMDPLLRGSCQLLE
eukprot:TRINITY_DN7367_c0_g1_i1.p1 TRINITY_DN7367_c0_g1~~TRINITY_DN7367_c0_g1_i1.p1  ORF type:complete len:419 (-),score=88.32 TRINITY_DN7367_c0_g1_i1:5-1261(-)